ncbi:CheR family methyltransferase [Candidatus Nitrospira salsa]|nr:MAG: chemotaxis protein methyltransferase [Nitrospirales bacterium]
MSQSLSETELQFVRELVREHSAIVLEPKKEYLVRARLQPLVKEEGLASISDLVRQLRHTSYGKLHRRVIEAMTTNETSFFRDLTPFEALRDGVLPELIKKREESKCLNIWCGASSSGQEPYTMALVIREALPESDVWKIKFFATDISTAMLLRCQEGKYNQMEVNRGLPAKMLLKYFSQEGLSWYVKEELRKMIEFKTMNLVGTWLPFPKLDIVFLRNVLIYFDVETKKKILAKIRDHLSPDGYLFLGGSETTLNLDHAFERVSICGTSCYRLRSV